MQGDDRLLSTQQNVHLPARRGLQQCAQTSINSTPFALVISAISGIRHGLPTAFWWAWPTMAIVLIDMTGWVAHGVALHVVVADLPGDMTLWDSLFFGPGSAVLGVVTGLPGGIGATEGLLGASLRLRAVPIEHLAIAIAAFRLITFWIWIPIDWLALAVINRRLSRPVSPKPAAHLAESEGIG